MYLLLYIPSAKTREERSIGVSREREGYYYWQPHPIHSIIGSLILYTIVKNSILDFVYLR